MCLNLSRVNRNQIKKKNLFEHKIFKNKCIKLLLLLALAKIDKT